MRKSTKVLALLGCAATLVVGSVMGTMAYLTSQDAVTNTFTVGNVKIHLDETDYDGSSETCNLCASGRDEKNAYHLMPGQTYTKDPQVTLLKGSEKSYIRMIVKVNDISKLETVFTADKYYGEDKVFLVQNLVNGWVSSKWEFNSYKKIDEVGLYEFRYFETVESLNNNTTLVALFNEIHIPGEEVTSENIDSLNGIQIDVSAEAIQAIGFDNADAAWAAFEAQK